MNKVLPALLRVNLRFFIQKVFATVSPGDIYLHNWHIDAIAHQLMLVHSGESRRLLINQPPRSLKSICVSVAYVAWLLGHDPTRRVIVASYSGDFAAELHRQFRMVIASQWYREVFPELQLAKETGLELVTSKGGSRYATSVAGTLTGRGADLIIIDDPLNANELHSETARKRVIEWYGGALVQRLNDKENGPIIVIMQRLHEDASQATFSSRVVGITSTCRRSRWRMRPSSWETAESCCAALAIFSIRSARAEKRLRRSRQRSGACFSAPNISNSRCRLRAILSSDLGSRSMRTCPPERQLPESPRAGTSP